MPLQYVSESQASIWSQELPILVEKVKAELIYALETKGRTAEFAKHGGLVVDGVTLYSDNFNLDLQRVSYSRKPTGKLFYRLSAGYHRMGTYTKVYPEPKAGFDIAKMAERVLEVAVGMKRASEAREDHTKRANAAEAVRDRAREHMKFLPAGVDYLVKSIDSNTHLPERVLVTLCLSERQVIALMRSIKLGELGDD